MRNNLYSGREGKPAEMSEEDFSTGLENQEGYVNVVTFLDSDALYEFPRVATPATTDFTRQNCILSQFRRPKT